MYTSTSIHLLTHSRRPTWFDFYFAWRRKWLQFLPSVPNRSNIFKSYYFTVLKQAFLFHLKSNPEMQIKLCLSETSSEGSSKVNKKKKTEKKRNQICCQEKNKRKFYVILDSLKNTLKANILSVLCWVTAFYQGKKIIKVLLIVPTFFILLRFYLSIYLSINLSIYLSIYILACSYLSIYLSVCVCVCVFAHIFIPEIYQSVEYTVKNNRWYIFSHLLT